jgi:hypothetical protein
VSEREDVKKEDGKKGEKNKGKITNKESEIQYVFSTVTSRLPAGTACLTAKRCRIFRIRVKHRSIKTTK